MRPWKLVCFGALAVILSSPVMEAQSLSTLPIHRKGMAVGSAAPNLQAADVNGDAIPEIIACGAGAPFAQQYVNGRYSTYWHGPTVACSGIAAGDVNGDGSTDIVVGTTTGSLLVFDARSAAGAQASAVVPASVAVADVVVGNVDADAALEIVVVTASTTFVYDGKTLTVDWAANGYGGTKAVLARADNDVQLEIIVNGTTGYVLDAAATERKLEWAYSGGFGDKMVAGNLDADVFSELVFLRSGAQSLTVLQTNTPAASAVIQLDSSIYAIAIGDGNGDGVDEIVTGDGYGDISGRHTGTGAKLWSIRNADYNNPRGLMLADLDGDGTAEVVWLGGLLYVGSPGAAVAVDWQSIYLDAPFTSDGADLDLDGSPDWLVASRGTASGYSSTLMEIINLRSGVSRTDGPKAPAGNLGSVSASAIGQLDTDPALEIAFLATNYYYYSTGALSVLDGVTLANQWTSAGTFFGNSVNLQNVDGDSWDEIIAATSDGKIVVLDGASNVIQATRPFAGSFIDLVIADTDGVGAPEAIVATSSTLSVLSLPSLTLRVEIPSSGMLNVAASSVSGGTVAATFNTGARLRTFAASTLAARWSCTAFSTESFTALTFATSGGTTALLAANSAGRVRSFRFGGADCATGGEVVIPSGGIRRLKLRDVTQDGRAELLVEGGSSTEIVLFSLNGEARGEVTGDGVTNEQDVSMLTNYVLHDSSGITPAADVNRDGRIGVEDIFGLIDHVYAGGAAPQP
jgi:hypothetical protein